MILYITIKFQHFSTFKTKHLAPMVISPEEAVGSQNTLSSKLLNSSGGETHVKYYQ